ncbi:hypothetical protein [uncultured Gimesia sp.]|uniref:hypothetical protein n=1 Tax=uncultured Gimesia sp. TaxID=1678688 RepID=UPI0026325CEE|nr:hypothetical protein [uncultured Gimesia sp.]
MSVRCSSFFAMSLYLVTVSQGTEPEVHRQPQKLPQSAHEKSRNLSALDHIRVATEQLEAVGLAEEAVKLREVSDKLKQRVVRERAELSRQITELQKQSEQLRRLTGRPDKILCRCYFLELSSKAAAEFAAAAESVSSTTGPQNRTAPAVSVYKNAEEVIQQLKKSGSVTVLHASPQIVTTPGRPATFKSGGEFPILIPAGKNRTSVEWKRFGVFCKVLPRLLDTGRIQLEFSPEISYRDFTNAVKVNGLTVPGLTVRRVNAKAEMNLGETLVVRTVSSTGSHVKTASAETDTAPPENTVMLFMVTPVAFD